MAKPAIKPDFYKHFPVLAKDERIESLASDKDKLLFGMSQTAGWALLEDDARQLMSEMDALLEQSVATGQPYEEIGKNTVIVNLAKGIIRRLLDKVEDAKEACGAGGQ